MTEAIKNERLGSNMNIRKILLTATASLLTVSSLIGCGVKGDIPYGGEEGRYVSSVTPLAYKYGEAEKELLAADGLFCDFEGEAVGTKYESDATSTITSGIFAYRPKLSVFNVVSSEDGNALKYERSSESAAQNTDPHIDIELGGRIPARADFVAEFDIMPENGNAKITVLQAIYRPESGRIISAGMDIVNGRLQLDGKSIADIPNGEFTKIACVYHQSAGTVDVYVNGYMVDYGVPYIKQSDAGHTPSQIRMIRADSGECGALLDNVAVYRGSEPKYVSAVSESDIKVVREYRFEGAEGTYSGESGFSVKAEKSTYNIIKTPDGRSVLKNGVISSEAMSLSTEGVESIFCFSSEIYLTSDNCDYTLAAFFGTEWTSVLEIRGNTLWNALEDESVYSLEKHKWVRVDLFVDGVKNICAVYVNGYRYVDSAPVPSDALTKMNSIRIGATSTPENGYSVYLDNVRLYNATGVLGYKGSAVDSIEKVYTVISPADYSGIRATVESELEITDAVHGTGDTTARISGFTKNYNISLNNIGLTKQKTGDYDLRGIDSVRIRYYSPRNAGRTFVLIFDCGNVFKDKTTGKCYYDGNWKDVGNSTFTCDAYPGVKAEKQWSYYHYNLKLDNEGWATVTIPLASLTGTRLPDWSHVEGIRLESTGWTLATLNEATLLPDEKAEYYIDTVELIAHG